jgi:hypothetical protein
MPTHTACSTTISARSKSKPSLSAVSTSTIPMLPDNSCASYTSTNKIGTRELRRNTFEPTPSSSRNLPRLSSRASTMPVPPSDTGASAVSTSYGDCHGAKPCPSGILDWAKSLFTSATLQPTRDSTPSAQQSLFETEYREFPRFKDNSEFPSQDSNGSHRSSISTSTVKPDHFDQPPEIWSPRSEAEGWQMLYGIWGESPVVQC